VSVLVVTAAKIQVGTAWTGTAPGTPGTQTVSGTITSPTDVSSMLQQVAFPMTVATKDATNFAAGGYMINVPGLKAGNVTFLFNQDFAASQTDVTIWSTLGLSTLAYVDIQPAGGTRSATSPSYVFACYVTQYHPISTKVGDLVQVNVTWPATGKFDRLTS